LLHLLFRFVKDLLIHYAFKKVKSLKDCKIDIFVLCYFSRAEAMWYNSCTYVFAILSILQQLIECDHNRNVVKAQNNSIIARFFARSLISVRHYRDSCTHCSTAYRSLRKCITNTWQRKICDYKLFCGFAYIFLLYSFWKQIVIFDYILLHILYMYKKYLYHIYQ